VAWTAKATRPLLTSAIVRPYAGIRNRMSKSKSDQEAAADRDLYSGLKSLETKGYLRSSEQRNGKSLRRVYRATPLGKKALAASKKKVRELFHELIEGD
jgi:DNA-binding PadR family transcriptional regulator